MAEDTRVEQEPSLDDVAVEARRRLKEFFTDDAFDQPTLQRAKVAATVLTAAARERQSVRAHEATSIMMAREIATTPEERQQYIAVTLPDHPMVQEMQRRRELVAPPKNVK